jgi:hypothetical protein
VFFESHPSNSRSKIKVTACQVVAVEADFFVVSVTQTPIVCLIRYHPALQISNLEGTYKHPCGSRPLYKKELYFFYFFFTTFLRENTPVYPSFALLSPCVAKKF